MSKTTFLGPLVGKGAGQYELVNAERGSVLATHVEPAFDSKSRRRGLLGRDAVPDGYALIIAPCSGVHTFSMRFPIDAVFVSRDGTVIKTCRAVKPWRIVGAWRAFAVIEAAPGFIDRTETLAGDVMGLREVPQKRRATDALPPLGASSNIAAGVPKVRHTDGAKRVTLADIVARKTPLGWFESVAIVQELCEVVLARGPADDLRVPELKHIAFTPGGSVELLAEGPAEHSPVHRASLVLLALTPEGQLPLQLRLLALEEVSPTPRFKSLKELHAELEFFERPDRLEIVRGACERYQLQQAPVGAEAIIPPPLLEPPPPRRQHRWWKRKSVRVGSGIVLMTLVAAAAVQQWPRPGGAWMRSGVAQASRAATVAAGEAARVAREQVRVVKWKLGWRQQPGAPPATTVSALPTTPRVLAPNAKVSPEPRPVLLKTPVLPPPQPQLPDPFPAAAIRPPEPATQIPGPTAQGAELVGTATKIYTSADPLVVPPELIRPSLPKALPAGARVEDLAEVEVVISTAGAVESVKLVSPGSGPQPAMMLSVIKTWTFQPATRGGQPVKYRHRMRLPMR